VLFRSGTNSTFELVEVVRELTEQTPLRAQVPKVNAAPAWLPRSEAGYLVITCPKCLRSFSMPGRNVEIGVLKTDVCIHCGEQVTYHVDSVVIADARRTTLKRAHILAEQSTRMIATSKTTIEDSKTNIGKSRRLTSRRSNDKAQNEE